MSRALGIHRDVVISYDEHMRNENYLSQYDYINSAFCSDPAIGFRHLAKTNALAHAKCNNHARRKVWEARFYDRKAVRSAVILYGKLFRVEDSIRHLPPDEKQQERMIHSKPLCDKLHAWAFEHYSQTPAGTSLRKACGYLLRHWNELCQFLRDGRMPFHTNDIENIFRIVASGRKAFLQVGSKKGGEALAVYYSLVISCILAEVST